MNAGQYEGLMRVITEIRDRMPERPADAGTWSQVGGEFVHSSDRGGNHGCESVEGVHNHARCRLVLLTTHHLDGSKTVATRGVTRGDREEGSFLALVAVNQALDGWIQAVKENHEDLGHRGESEPCWRSFAPSDIRNMVNDAARELGLQEFPEPAHPEEDKPL